MPKTYQCEKCGKEFSQKSNYNQHLNRKTPCIDQKIYNVISLFSGIGGMDMGFGGDIIVHRRSIVKSFKNNIQSKDKTFKNFVVMKPTNFNVAFQNDILPGAKEICEINKTACNYIIESIYDLLNRNYKFPKADVVIGGFPCQDFSHCGKRKGFNSDKSHNMETTSKKTSNNRGTLYKSFVAVVKKVKPKIFIAENVHGLLTMKGDPIKQIIKDFSKIGYDVNYSLVKANEHGVPQKRWRVIIIGINKTRTKKNLSDDWYIIDQNKIKCPIKYYYQHLKEPDESDDVSQQLYSKAKKLDKGQGQVEINMNGFAPTIRAEHHGNIEFRRHNNTINKGEEDMKERRLTIREAGLAQTFPPGYIFNIKKTMTSYKYIGNAVPPLLAYVIARKVEDLLSEYF